MTKAEWRRDLTNCDSWLDVQHGCRLGVDAVIVDDSSPLCLVGSHVGTNCNQEGLGCTTQGCVAESECR